MHWTSFKSLILGASIVGLDAITIASPATAQTPIRVGWCTKAPGLEQARAAGLGWRDAGFEGS